MTTTLQTPSRASQAQAESAPRDGRPDPLDRRRWALLLGTWLGLALLVGLAQLGRRTPTAFIDELTFGRVAQNIGFGDGATFQGAGSGIRTVYVYLVAPAWALFEGTTAYRVALGINAVVMTSVVLPAFGLARHVAPFRWALAAAACAALVPAMVWSGMLMTEAVAYPAAAWALLAMVHALRNPGARGALLVGVAVGAAFLARTQLIVLLAVFALAVVLDVARGGRPGLRDRVRRHRIVLAGAGLGTILVVGLVFAGERSFGTYACVVADAPSPTELAGPLADYAGTFFVATLGLPVIALVALALRRASWGDDRLGPVLCVAIAATAGFLGQAAWTAVTVSPQLQERYVFYAAPVLVALLAALPGRARPRTVALTAAAATLYAVAVFPGFADVTGEVVAQRLGLPGPLGDVLEHDAALWGLAFAVLGGAAYAAVRMGGERGVAVALGAAALFGAATFGVRQLDANRASSELAAVMADPADVVDRLTGGEPAGVVVGARSNPTALFHLQLWNRSVDRAYRIGIPDAFGIGQLCPIAVGRDGGLGTGGRSCAGRDALPRWLVFLDGPRRPFRVANGDARYATAGIRIVEFAPGVQPRLRLAPGDDPRRLAPPPKLPRDTDAPLGACSAT